MKISIVIVEGSKQIMLTPETDHEKQSLRMINPEDELKVVSRWGSFTSEHNHANLQVGNCEGGYLRAFSEKDSLMFLIKDKKKGKKMIMDIHKQQMDLITNSILKEVEDPQDKITELEIEQTLEIEQAMKEKLANKAWEDTMTEEETQELELKQEQEQRYGELDRRSI